MTLTARRIATLTEPGRYGDGNGLLLQITKGGSRSWIFRYERNGKERMMGLGPLRDFTLSEARERARKMRQLLHDGIDPLEQRRAEKAQQALAAARVLTFEQAARQYHTQHESKWRNGKHRFEFLSSLERYAFPKIGNLSVADIDTGDVLRCIEEIWPTKTETANRTRSRIERVLSWCTIRGYRTGDNSARWRGHLSEVLPARSQVAKVRHMPALPYSDLPAFLTALRSREALSARALEFVILTAARTGEVIGATWDEIDFGNRTWVIPASRMKADNEHRVPLSDAAIELLKALPREKGNDRIFIGPRSGGLSNMAMATLLRRMDRKDITVHGFRSTFRDWAAEQTAYPNHVVEQALAHTIGNAVERAYRRGDLFQKRKRLMADWARYCASASTTATVVPIRKRSAG